MGLRVNTNMDALIAMRNLQGVGNTLTKSIERLSSGLRINHAADDAAGLSISQKLDAAIRGTNQASRNAQDAISMIQTGEGALSEVHDMIQRMRELAVQAGNDTLNRSDRSALAAEITQLQQEIHAISQRTTFNGNQLLSGNLATVQDLNTVVTAGGLNVGTSTGAVDANHIATVPAGGTQATSLLTGTVVTVTNVNVTGASPSTTYTLSDSIGNGDSLSLDDGAGHTSSIYNVKDTADGNSQTLTFDFSSGTRVTITVTNTSGSTKVIADLVTDLTAAGTNTIKTASGGGSAVFQIGPDGIASNQQQVSFVQVDVAVSATNPALLGLYNAIQNFAGGLSVATATSLLTAADLAVDAVSQVRSNLGAFQNRLQHAVNSLNVSAENLTASESRIRDTDVAAESVNLNKSLVLQQAGVSVLAQANVAPNQVLPLLRG